MRFLSFIVFVVFLVASAPQAARAEVLLIAPRIDLTGNLAMLADVDQSLTIEQVSDPRMAKRFQPLAQVMNLKPGMNVTWLRFTISNPQEVPTERWLELEPAFFDYVDLYVPQPDGSHNLHRVGAKLPFSANEVAYRLPTFKLQIPPSAPQTYYVRIESGKRSNIHLRLWEPSAFMQAVGKEQLAFGLYLGIYLLLALSSLWFERVMKDRVYLFFSLYVFACILTTLTTTGLWQQYVLPDHPQWFDTAYGFSIVFLIAAAPTFFIHFVEVKRQRPWISKLYLIALWGYSALIFAIVAIRGDGGAMDIHDFTTLFIILPLAICLVVPAAWRSTNEIRHAFIGGALCIMAAYLYASLARFGVIESTILSRNALYISSMTFFLIIFYSISQRYQRVQLAKESAQGELLEMTRESARELEKQVADRTRELLEAVHLTEAALQQAQTVQKEQRHFIATVSHELRTPLAVIDATTQNMVRGLPTTLEKGQARVQKIRHATQRLSTLLDDYLNDDRFGELTQGVTARHVLLLPLLQDAVEAARMLSESHVMETRQADTMMEVWADPHYLRLVLRTLVDNAVKYTESGTRVTLQAQASTGGWHIDVIDTGKGIPEDEQISIFEYYYRGRVSAAHIGTGLGLPLARKFAEMQGGTLELMTSDVGGTILRLFLPYPEAVPG